MRRIWLLSLPRRRSRAGRRARKLTNAGPHDAGTHDAGARDGGPQITCATSAPRVDQGYGGGAIDGRLVVFAVDDHGDPLANATVLVRGADLEVLATTDATGCAEIEVASGPVEVHVMMIGRRYVSWRSLSARELTVELRSIVWPRPTSTLSSAPDAKLRCAPSVRYFPPRPRLDRTGTNPADALDRTTGFPEPPTRVAARWLIPKRPRTILQRVIAFMDTCVRLLPTRQATDSTTASTEKAWHPLGRDPCQPTVRRPARAPEAAADLRLHALSG